MADDYSYEYPRYRGDSRTITREGSSILDWSFGACLFCDSVVYSKTRSVDYWEPLPVEPAHLISLVRDEKQFGEFWKDINAEPLINKVLGTDAYNAGYSIGSLLRSTWVELGLLLGVGGLVYAWWRRRHLRAA